MMKKIAEMLKNLFLSVPLQEKVIFARHLSLMAKAGIPIMDSLKMLKKQTKSKSLAKILDQAAVDVNNGQFLSASLGKHENIFGHLFINIIRIGEASGTLSENLAYLADELKKKQELRRKVIGALIYPIVILSSTFGLTGLLTIVIFPKILPVFRSLNVELPFTTKLFIQFSTLITEKGHWAALGVALFLISVWLILKIKKVRFASHYLILKLPVVGGMARAVNIANFCRTLGLLLKSGVKIIEAVGITGDTLSNLIYKKELEQLSDQIKKGGSLAQYFSKRERSFPPMISQMIEVGETTGNLSESLFYLSEFYESEFNEATKNLSNILEPLLMITMGLIVGFIAISIITPIYKVTQTMGR